MPATVMALRDDDVQPGGFDLDRVAHRAYHGHHLGVVGAQPLHPGSRIAQAGCIDRHPLFDHHFHLGIEECGGEHGRLIRIADLAQRCGIHRREAFPLHEVAGEILQRRQLLSRCRTARTLVTCPSHRRRQQGIDPEWFVGEFPGATDPLPQLPRSAGGRAKHPKAAGIRYRCGQLRTTGSAHAGEHDRILYLQDLADTCSEIHFSPSNCP